MKYSVTYANVAVVDQLLFMQIFCFVCDLTTAKCMGYDLSVDKSVRCALYSRSIMGVFGSMSMMYGVTMVPIICHLTITATIPFWAAFFGFMLLGETIDTTTKVAMIFCLIGVTLIATSPYLVHNDSGAEVTEE